MKKYTFLIAFLFVFGFLLRAQSVESWDFASNNIGDLFDEISWGATDIETEVADDPVTSGNNVLKNSIHNYNAAPVLRFVLPAGKTLADYGSFTFKGYFAQGDVGFKDIIVEAYQDSPTAQAFNNTDVRISSWNRAQMGSSSWEDIAINITNSSTINDTFYIAFGINCAGTGDVGGSGVTTIWYSDDVTLVPKAVDTTLVDKWGETSQGKVWPILNDAGTPAGNASIGGPNPIPGWATVRGEFDTLVATTVQAVVVTGKIQFVGASGGGSTYTPLRYALTYHANDTLNYPLTDSASWVRGPGSGYAFMPRSAAGIVSNGAWGSGTVGVINNGNWNSSNSSGGPALATILQAPRNAEIIPGTYDFAISVNQVNDTTNEIRWYLVEETNKYWFGGTVTGPAPTTKFNGICFGVNTGGWTQVNLTEVKAELGDPITVPEAPWEPYYVDLWGQTTQGKYWPVKNDSTYLVGDATIKGTAPINGAGQATVRGGFGQDLQIKTDKALIVSGELELVGTLGGESSYNPLRYALTYFANDTLKYALTDSAQWVRGPSLGYNWCPRTGAGIVANGAWGSGTVGVVNNGNWNSTNSSGGPALATILQAPRNAQMIPGTYKWAISVQQVNDTTNEIRWYLIEKVNNKYWFGGIVRGTAVTNKLNGVSFGLNTGDWTEFNILAAQVDYGNPIDIPTAPFEDFYVSQWGFLSRNSNNWTLTPGAVTGNVSIAGPALTNWVALRGGFGEAVDLRPDTSLVITGQMELVGGGFEAWSSLRMGVFYSDSAGTIDSASWTWTGNENGSYGYIILPHSGTNDLTNWQGISQLGSAGALVNRPWVSTNGANDYVLSANLQRPSGAVGSAGTYNFAYSFTPMGGGVTEVRYYVHNNNYAFGGIVLDNHSPLTTTKFNSINFAVNNSTTTGLNLVDVHVELGDTISIPSIVVSVEDNETMPVQFALEQNYPNPFNPTTTIEFALPKQGEVTLVIYDALGRVVKELVKGNYNAGYYSVNFNASNLASGVYFYKIEAGDFVSVKKLMLLK